MEYKIIQARSDSALETRVNEYIKIGYKPLGGMSIKYNRNSGFYSVVEEYYQVLIKE